MIFCVVINGIKSNLLSFVRNDKIKSLTAFFSFNEHSGGTAEIYISEDRLYLLSRLGYSHRDFHLDNLLIGSNGEIYWIDNHFKKLSFFNFMKVKQFDYSIRHIIDLVKNVVWKLTIKNILMN